LRPPERKAFREKFLCWLGQRYQFDVKGDLDSFSPQDEKIKISCVINFFGRLDLLAGILYSLVGQNYPKEQFEVILVEDRGGTEAGRTFCESFSDCLQIVYQPLDKQFGHMGYSRNYGLSKSRGEFILLLDDDTVILQQDFFRRLEEEFYRSEDIDAIIPHGTASYSLWPERYAYHEPFFMTSRCMAYRRSVLEELKGYLASIVGQEDVEFVVRFAVAGKNAVCMPDLNYYHPPLLYPKLDKPKAVGSSFMSLRHRYPLPLFVLLLINCVRHLPLYFWPTRAGREKSRFAFGFAVGIFRGLLGRESGSYQ
jgi:glycosyltransferase involved in cell wall biosynthesis